MKDLWVLSVRTSLPETCERADELKVSFAVFESFGKAKEAMRAKIKEFAFAKNSMFDGRGRIKYLDKYIKEDDFDDYEEDDVLTVKRLRAIQEALTAAFSGEDAKIDVEDGNYTDWTIAATVEDGEVRFYGDDDGPINGYDPVLRANIFSMEAERDYWLYIDDAFGQDCATSELYIDLKKATVV